MGGVICPKELLAVPRLTATEVVAPSPCSKPVISKRIEPFRLVGGRPQGECRSQRALALITPQAQNPAGTDETSNPLFQVVRLNPKGFFQRCPDGNGDWDSSMKGVRCVLYRLTEVIKAVALGRTIFIAEGEKAVDALVKLGVTATCSPMGAGKWREEYSLNFANADVVILPDNDEPGERHCEAVAKSLAGIGARVRIFCCWRGFRPRAMRLTGCRQAGPPNSSRSLLRTMLLSTRRTMPSLLHAALAPFSLAGAPPKLNLSGSSGFGMDVSHWQNGPAARDMRHLAASSSSALRMERRTLSFPA
jgi:hypothetical protein